MVGAGGVDTGVNRGVGSSQRCLRCQCESEAGNNSVVSHVLGVMV